jgi:holo-[acyl-carrier protein] synthase
LIFGIGTDVVSIERIQRLHEKYGERFVEHLLMPAEAQGFRDQTRPVRFLAMRFAAKEAIVKAMGTGFAHGMWLRDCGVVANTWGRPEIIWSARGRERCEQLGIGEGHVTLTDEAGLTVAVAVLMRKAAAGGE